MLRYFNQVIFAVETSYFCSVSESRTNFLTSSKLSTVHLFPSPSHEQQRHYVQGVFEAKANAGAATVD